MTDRSAFAFCGPLSRALLLGSAGLAAFAGASPARAADTMAAPTETDAPDATADDGGNEIIVTARHREERLQDVPLAISAVSGAELNGQHLDRIADYANKIPNFSAFASNPRVATINIRGLGGNASNDGAEGGVGLIVDDVVFTHVGFAWLDFVDLESVEVARGPQGTLLGKNTTIGAVVVRTAKPSFDTSVRIEGTVANRERYQIRANATGALIGDKLAYRLTFARDQGGGWVTNQPNGAKLLDNNRWSIRGQLLFQPAPNISDRLIGEYYEFAEYNNHSSPVGDLAQNLYVNAPGHADNSVFSARTGSWTTAIGRIDPAYKPNLVGPYNANFDTLGRTRQKVKGVSNILNADFGWAALTSVTAWRNLSFRPFNDFDLTPYPAWDTGFNVDVNQYSQELRLASRTAKAIDWQIGAYYLHEDLASDNYNRYFAKAGQFFAGIADSAVLNGITASRLGKVKVDSGAVFAQTTLHLGDRFSITQGVRYTRERKQLNVTGRRLVTGGLADSALTPVQLATRNAVLTQLGLPTFADTEVSTTGNYWSWLVNPSYKLTDDILLYFSASGGAKSGAANTTSIPAIITAGRAVIRPEKSTDFELGIKSSWFGKTLDINLNLYRNDITDYQASQIDPNSQSLGSILGNVGKVRLQGFELETSARPVRGISLNANVAYNDAKYLSYDNAPAPTEYQAYLATVQNVAARSTTLSLTGYRVIGVPKWTVNGGVAFDIPADRNVNITGYVNESYRSSAALINPRSQFGQQGGYAITNAGLGLKAPDGNWSINIWSRNLFGKRFAIGYSGASPFTPTLAFWGEPRTLGITAAKTF